MNLLLHGVEDFKIVREDTLRNPAFYTGNHLAQFDCVVANPPFSLKNWGEAEWAADKWGRNSLGGMPPKGYADWAWVQHMLTSARPKSGRVAVVLPQGALFRQGAEATIRTHILKSDVVDAVIGLAPEPLLRHRPRRLRSHPPLAEAARERRARCSSSTASISTSAAATRTRLSPSTPSSCSTPTSCSATSTGSPASSTSKRSPANDYNLNISLYVAPADSGEKVTLADALADLEAAQARAARDPGGA